MNSGEKFGRNAVKLYMVQIHRVTGSEMGRIRTREDADPQPVFGKILNEVPNQVPQDEDQLKENSEEGKVGKAITEALQK